MLKTRRTVTFSEARMPNMCREITFIHFKNVKNVYKITNLKVLKIQPTMNYTAAYVYLSWDARPTF